jgi:hypothetical protein
MRVLMIINDNTGEIEDAKINGRGLQKHSNLRKRGFREGALSGVWTYQIFDFHPTDALNVGGACLHSPSCAMWCPPGYFKRPKDKGSKRKGPTAKRAGAKRPKRGGESL